MDVTKHSTTNFSTFLSEIKKQLYNNLKAAFGLVSLSIMWKKKLHKHAREDSNLGPTN